MCGECNWFDDFWKEYAESKERMDNNLGTRKCYECEKKITECACEEEEIPVRVIL